eukprot:12047211-Ditylum_brightwellii.AAC.1
MQELGDSSIPRPDEHMVNDTTIARATQSPIYQYLLLGGKINMASHIMRIGSSVVIPRVCKSF